MKRKAYGRDAGLSLRMLLTVGMLGLLYVVFAVVLFNVLNVGLVPMLVIVIAAGRLASRISGFPCGIPPSTDFSTLPRTSAARADRLLALAPAPGTKSPTAPRPA